MYQDLPETDLDSASPLSSATSAPDSEFAIIPSVLAWDHASPEFPPVYFLDFELYQRAASEIPRVVATVRPDLLALTHDIREQAKVYFPSIHPWIPFLSKKSFNERLLSPFTPRGVDLTLLFASIKLVSSVPRGGQVRTNTYVTFKSSLLEAEMLGVLSLRLLQAWILLCVYEFCHAMYPSAYLSIGSCARYAAALGLDLNEANPQRETFDWIETEERRRAMWAILMLDR